MWCEIWNMQTMHGPKRICHNRAENSDFSSFISNLSIEIYIGNVKQKMSNLSHLPNMNGPLMTYESVKVQWCSR